MYDSLLLIWLFN